MRLFCCARSLGSTALTVGVYRWRVLLDVDDGAATCVGVAQSPALCSDKPFPFGHRCNMWYYRSYKGLMYSRGAELDGCVAPFSDHGCIVDVSDAGFIRLI